MHNYVVICIAFAPKQRIHTFVYTHFKQRILPEQRILPRKGKQRKETYQGIKIIMSSVQAGYTPSRFVSLVVLLLLAVTVLVGCVQVSQALTVHLVPHTHDDVGK